MATPPISPLRTTPKDIFEGQPKDALWRSINVPTLDWNDVGIDCFLGRGAFTHVHKGNIKNRRQARIKTFSSVESDTVALSQSSFSLVSLGSSSSSIESIPLEDPIDQPHQSVDSGLTTSFSTSPSQSSQQQGLCAIKCINPTKTKKKAALLSASNDLLNEALLLSELNAHENIVNFIGILPQVVDEEEDDQEESKEGKRTRPGMFNKENAVKDYVLVLECLDETLAARLKRWRKEQLQMQKQQEEIWLAQELVLEQKNRLPGIGNNNDGNVGRGRRLGRGVRNLWQRWNNNHRGNNGAIQPAGRRNRWGLRGEQQPQQQQAPTTNHDTSARNEDYRDLVNAETNEYRLKQMNERMETIALGIVNGMRHMHEHRIVHRDLKPQNIGFDLKTQTVKLFDFGLARQLPYDVNTATARYYSHSQRRRSSLGSNGAMGRRRSNGSTGSSGCTGAMGRRRSNGSTGSDSFQNVPPNPTAGEVVGTWRYMAPETMQSMGSDYASDVFSFAIVWSEICTLQRPYFNDEDDEDEEMAHPANSKRSTEQLTKNRCGPYQNWNQLKSFILEDGKRPNLASLPKQQQSSSSDLKMWINQCWDPEPYRRPTFDSLHDLLQHYCDEHTSLAANQAQF